MEILSFEHYITESFNSSPAQWKFINGPKEVESLSGAGIEIRRGKASFKIKGRTYFITAFLYSTGETEIDFSMEVKTSSGNTRTTEFMTNTGDQYKVLSTVIDFIAYIMKNYENDYITFTSIKPTSGIESKTESRSRGKVYERLAKKYVQQISKELNETWVFTKREMDGYDRFLIRKTK